MKRVRVKRIRPNKLFETWLEEWRDKANPNMKYNFSKALESLKKYPLPLKSGKDCIVLQHFGTKLCMMLDSKLEKHVVGINIEKRPPKKQLAIADVQAPVVSTPQNISLLPKNFDVILLVDTNERTGDASQGKCDSTTETLRKENILFEVRHLKVGDFAWIARCRTSKTELVLPYIVERKRIDDLGSSIKDGRYHEQKFRLKQSGITNIIYMIESHGRNDKYGSLPMSTLLQASINSVVQDEFIVKFTNDHRHSMLYLAQFTESLTRLYKDKQLIQCDKENLISPNLTSNKVFLMEFNTFNQASSKIKTYTVKEMFIRQLLQLKGLSLDRAMAIVEYYPTPMLLRQAFLYAGTGGEELLSNLRFGRLQRKFGSSLSKTLYQFYTSKNLL
ncbi:hypothetical protein PV325_005556 [Microctonus aethiopoides]|nr:hypothetical protein PV325_005556 [Microctonus aethiopoides]